MLTLRTYTRSIASQTTQEIHRFREVAGLAPAVPTSERGRRRPSSNTALEIFRRDGFRCRYCGCRIVAPQAQSVISALLPGAVQWGTRDAQLNAAFFTLKGVLDHVDPHAHGCTSEPENLVVACQPCNYGKGNWFTQQLGLSNPRLRPPRVDDWDGLLRVLPLRPAKVKTRAEADPPRTTTVKREHAPRQPRAPKRGLSIDEFASAFSVPDRRHLDALLQALESCGDIGVFWTSDRVLLAKIRVGDITLSALGIEPDTTVQIPWFIGPHKSSFRPFAETLAAALPDATVYETEKMWRVRCRGRVPRLSELMQDTKAVQVAFRALHRALTHPTIRSEAF
jgi:5-methylcytosine-specific restriction endonuclease McrA